MTRSRLLIAVLFTVLAVLACGYLEGPTRTIAKRDIDPGEELTSDYRLFDLDSRSNGFLAVYR